MRDQLKSCVLLVRFSVLHGRLEMQHQVSLDNVPRIRAPSPEVFSSEYVAKQTPVILIDLFDKRPLSALFNEVDAVHCLGSIELRAIAVTENFIEPPKVQNCTLSEYREWIRRNPACDLWCYQPLPDKLRKMAGSPPYVNGRADNISRWLYVSNARPPLSLHFDVDFKQNLMTQVFGRKRFILIAPRYSKRLSPYFNYSMIALTNYSEREKREFTIYHHAFDCVLKPGETLFIPKSWWHYVEYLDFSMSISVRFARNPFDAALAKLPLSYYLQNLGNRMINEASGTIEYRDSFHELFDSYYRRFATPRSLYQRYYRTKELLYQQICEDALQGQYVSNDFNLEFKRIKTSRSIWGPLRTPIPYDGDRPDLPISRRQLDRIQKCLSGLGGSAYKNARLTTFLGEKKALGDFNRLEAAQLLDQLPRQ